MKTKFVFALLSLLIVNASHAQKKCSSHERQQLAIQADPSNIARQEAIETFTRNYISSQNFSARTFTGVIKIPVVVHILYHQPHENISDAQVISQLAVLNESFRRRNADTANTPARFKGVAADIEIEFQLAISDPRRRNTTGIVRKYTPVAEWADDDKMKFSAEMGADAWDTRNYLNIWICNLQRVAGYASMPGGPAANDGIVLGYGVVGSNSHTAGFNMGKTAVHEVGHWLNLRHLWGDDYCGDDGVSDTPKQAGYNTDCPTGVSVSCTNGPLGDMYMNYMDFTNDVCMNMFSLGQKARMRSLFATGGARNSMLTSTGLLQPLIFEVPLPEEDPKWLHSQLFPNPAVSAMTLDLSYDQRWIGKTLTVTNMQGQAVMQITISSKLQPINVSGLKAGMYFLTGKKEGGDFIRHKFIKL